MTFANRQAVFHRADLSLAVAAMQVAGPPEGGLLARVTLAGVCGTDRHRLSGDVVTSWDRVAFGHEATGVVLALDPGLRTDSAGTPVVAGDRITWFPNASCYRCHACVVLQNPSLCEHKTWPEPAGVPSAAGFQELAALTPNVVFFRIPDDTPDEAVIAFGCGLPTAVTAVARAGPLAGTETVLIQGSGPVGLAATLLMRHTTARQVILFGATGLRLAWGRRLGADVVVDITATTPAERLDLVRSLTGGRGADVAIEAAGVLPAFAEGMDLLAPQGRYVIAGLYAGTATVPFNPVLLNNRNLQLTGSLSTSPRDKLAGVLAAQRFEPGFNLSGFVTHRFALAETGAAIERARQDDTGKAIVMPQL